MTGDASRPANAHAKIAVLDEETIAELGAFNLRFERG
jgi:hypothetical protein